MKYVLMVLILFLSALAGAQNNQPTKEQIRAQMQQIRQNTNWDDPAAAEKANAEIKKLANQLSGGQSPVSTGNNSKQQAGNNKPASPEISTLSATKENVVAIADRYYKRSYKSLDAVSRSQFDQDYKKAAAEEFNLETVHRLTSKGGLLITLTDDTDLGCLYLTSAVKVMPTDTLSINNFGGYLRMIDSTEISVPVLLYAKKLFSGSPVILTQLGNSYFELGEYAKAESYYKDALKINPDFGQAHSALCDLYIKQERLQDAILELFAGVKNMGCSYSQASNNFAYLQQQSEKAADAGNKSAKEDFWNETKRQVDPADALAPLVPDDSRVKIPDFPDCQRVEDWLEGGGWSSAVQAYKAYQSYLMSFNEKFMSAHSQSLVLAPGAVMRDYPDARLAIDCITKKFSIEADYYRNEYQDRVDQIIKGVNNAKESYINDLEQYTNQYKECWEGCGGNGKCIEECHRKFCKDECPNANKFNEYLRRAYHDWTSEFNKLVIVQRSTIDDLYGFAMPWLNKIESPYWSLIYAYEIKRTALLIAGNCYGAYPQAFQALSHNTCGNDCSVYANPYPEKPEEINKKDPEGNECSMEEGTKKMFSYGPASFSWDCESFEFSISAGLSGSIKRNSVRGTTTLFLGAGLEAGAGGSSAGGKFGGQLIIGDNYSVNGGLKSSASGNFPDRMTRDGVTGGEIEFNITVLDGVKGEFTKIVSPFYFKP